MTQSLSADQATGKALDGLLRDRGVMTSEKAYAKHVVLSEIHDVDQDGEECVREVRNNLGDLTVARRQELLQAAYYSSLQQPRTPMDDDL